MPRVYRFINKIPSSISIDRLSMASKSRLLQRSSILRCSMITSSELIGYWFALSISEKHYSLVRLILDAYRRDLFNRLRPALVSIRQLTVGITYTHTRLCSWLSRAVLLHNLILSSNILLCTVSWITSVLVFRGDLCWYIFHRLIGWFERSIW